MPLSHSADRKLVILITLTFLASVPCAFECSTMAGTSRKQAETECDIQNTSCTKTLMGCAVTLDIKPKPVKAMKDLTFTIAFSGERPLTNPKLNLEMPGMRMGPNQIDLKSVGYDIYEGKGIIVRCPSGRRTWKAIITIPDMGTVDFIFDVID